MLKASRKVVGLACGTALLLSSFSTAYGASVSSVSDIKGHWAEQQITSWISQGYISGYGDGTFKPNNEIKRGEFFALVNRSFGFTETAAVNFKDLKATDWQYADVEKAVKVGYVKGYEDQTIRPNSPITRQEIAVIIANLDKLSASDSSAAGFKDAGLIAAWSKGAVGAVVSNKIMVGYKDNTFLPTKFTTRAEAVVTLSNALASNNAGTGTESKTEFNAAGTYGPATGTQTINGNVTISAPGVTLQNIIINGKLTFAEGIGSGDAYLKNVKVNGETLVAGGGEHSIHFENSVLLTVTVDKKTGAVRIVVEGSTTVGQVVVNSPATLQESNETGTGFEDVELSKLLPEGSEVTLEGTFDNVDVVGSKLSVNIPSGSVQNVTANDTSEGMTLNVGEDAKIVKLVLDAIIKMIGKGTIEVALVSDAIKSGTTFETTPLNLRDTTGPVYTAPPVVETNAVVKNVDELTKALAKSTIKTIQVNGTIGDADHYTAYNVNRAVTIKGSTGSKIYGSFVITADGAKVDGLTMYTRGGGNGPLKTAIDVIAKSVTITNNTFELPNPEALAASGGVGNGVTIWPVGSAAANYVVNHNTFKGYGADTEDWSSTALSVVEGMDLARFYMSGTISQVVDLSATEQALATGNTYENCTNSYIHSNWSDGINYRYFLASNADQLSGVEFAGNGATVLVSGTIGSEADYTAYEINKAITIQGLLGAKVYGSFIIKADGAKVDGLTMYTRGGGSGPLKTAIDVIAKSVTITNNTFELPNPEALAASGGVGNGVTIWPVGLGTPNYVVNHNTFKGYGADTDEWSSTALSVVEGLDLARFNMPGVTSQIVDLSATEQALATGNTYENCTNSYIHSNWSDGINYRYFLASNADQLSGVEFAGNGATVLVSGTIGSEADYTAYEINKAITIQGLLGAKVYGSFIIKADGAKVDGLTMYTRGGGSGPLKTAIDVIAKSVTITNNTFELPNPEALAASGGVGNGVTIWPVGSAAANYVVNHNTFKGYGADTEDWSSTALSVVEGLDLARFGMSGTISQVVDLSATEEELATGNTYENCTNSYIHSNWSDGINYRYFLVSNADQLSNVEFAGNGATVLLANDIAYSDDLTIANNVTLTGGHAVTIADGKALTVNAGATLTIADGTEVHGSIVGEGNWTGKLAD